LSSREGALTQDSQRTPESPFTDRNLWLAENDLAVVVDQPEPWMVSPGHCLIVPRRRVATVWVLSRQEWLACLDLIDVMKARIDAERKPDGYNIGINCGEAAGQTVFHAHIHLIPRYWGDDPAPRGGVHAVIPGKKNY
jgi:diadenosine tetraphosphate (Ap4A) HIT family hydrolase